MRNNARELLQTVVVPNRWTVLFQKQDSTRGPVTYYHKLDFTIEYELIPAGALGVNEDLTTKAPVLIYIQTSEDKETWTTVYQHASALMPGGQATITYYNYYKWVRVIAYSATSAQITGSLYTPEEHTTPPLEKGLLGNTATCISACEMGCETACEEGTSQVECASFTEVTPLTACTYECEAGCETSEEAWE